MAASFPADFFVSVPQYSDPSENRPKDDQAIVLQIRKDIPMKVYCEELNKYIKNEDSFKYVSKISGDRLCVVLEKAEQAAMLVDQVQGITVNNEPVQIKYFVGKSVKVIISNTGYGVSKSSLKKFITAKCGIRTASSVSEPKASVDPGGSSFKNTGSFRRAIYIHPEDVNKLPKGPIKFYTGTTGFNVFFEVDNPKCFLCSQPGHFRNSCPSIQSLPGDKNLAVDGKGENESNNSISSLLTQQSADDLPVSAHALLASPASLSNPQSLPGDKNPAVDGKGENENNNSTPNLLSKQSTYDLPASAHAPLASPASLLNPLASSQPIDTQELLPPSAPCPLAPSSGSYTNMDLKDKFKRTHSTTSGEDSLVNADIIENSPEIFKQPKTKNKTNASKKARKEDAKKETNFIERSRTVRSLLAPAQSHIEATLVDHLLNFEDFVTLLSKSSLCNQDDRKTLVTSLHYPQEVLKLIDAVYNIIANKGLRQKLTYLRKAIEPGPDQNDSSQSEISEASDSEFMQF